jgi:IPT/TIG domain-containing protein/WD40 repeat protein
MLPCASSLALLVLWSAPPSPRQVVKLNDTPASGFDVTNELVSPDGQRVVFEVHSLNQNQQEVYSVPIDRSSPPVRLDLQVPPGGFVDWGSFLRITPDSSLVVYVQVDGANRDLYGIPIDGSLSAVRLTPSNVAGRGILQFETSPSGQTVFVGDQEVDGVDELFAVPSAGGADPVRLAPALPSDRDVKSFRLTPDGQWVIYLADQDVNDQFEFYRVSLAGGPSLRLNAGGEPRNLGYEVSSDSERLVYLAGHVVVSEHTDYHLHFFSVPCDGSQASVTLNPVELVTYLPDQLWWDISADSSRVAYKTSQSQIVSVPIAGGAPPLELTDLFLGDAALTPDGSRAVYLDPAGIGFSPFKLFSVPLDGSSAPVELSPSLTSSGDVVSFTITPDSTHVAFTADATVDGRFDLFAAPIDGSSAALPLTTVSSSLVRITADSKSAVYLATLSNLWILRSVPLDGCRAPRNLHPGITRTMPFHAGVLSAMPVAGTDLVLFRADLQQPYVVELFTSADFVSVTSISPDQGSGGGGNVVTIHGDGFTPTTEVWFGSTPAMWVLYVSPQTLTVLVPAHAPNSGPGSVRTTRPRTVDVRVQDCGSVSTLASAYTFHR